MGSIGWAVESMKIGNAVARHGWNGKGQYIELEQGNEDKRISPSVWMTTVQGNSIPWLCSQTDLLADDWYVV